MHMTMRVAHTSTLCLTCAQSPCGRTDARRALDYRRETTATAITDVDLRFLTLEDFKEVCSVYPSVRTHLLLLVNEFGIYTTNLTFSYFECNNTTN